MRRMTAVILIVVLLAGCSSTASLSTSNIPPSTSLASITHQPTQPMPTTHGPASTELSTQKATPKPVELPVIDKVFPKLEGATNEPALRIGNAVIADDTSIFYTDLSYDVPQDADYYAITQLTRQDRKTGQKELLRELPDQFITSVFLDQSGVLFYTITNEDYTEALYRFAQDHDILVAGNVQRVLRVDQNVFYVASDGIVHRYSSQLSSDMVIGITQEPNEEQVINYDDSGLIRFDYENDTTKTMVFYDRQGKTVNTTTIQAGTSEYVFSTLLVENTLYVITNEEEEKHSILYTIQNNQVSSKVEVDYLVHGAWFYQGKWYLYTAERSEDDSEDVNQQIQVFTPGKKKTVKLFDFEAGAADSNYIMFEVEADTIWIIKSNSIEEMYDILESHPLSKK